MVCTSTFTEFMETLSVLYHDTEHKDEWSYDDFLAYVRDIVRGQKGDAIKGVRDKHHPV